MRKALSAGTAGYLSQQPAKTSTDYQAIQDYYLKIIRCMPNNVYWLDRNCITQGCNENTLKLVGLRSLDQFIGITYEEMGKLAGWTEGQAESFKRDDMEVMATGIAKYNLEEPPLYDAQGSPVYYLSSRVPIFNENNEVIGVIGISVDITERKRNEQALKEALEEVRAANQARTFFLENISHDIKTPLTGIISSAEYLVAEAKESRLKECAESIYKSGRRFYELTEELIEISRLGVDAVTKKKMRFKGREVIDSLVELVKPAIEDKALTLTVKYDENIPLYLIGNRSYFYRLLLNVLTNAIKFTREGRITFEVCLEKRNKREVIIKITIQDTGIGIPKDKSQLIFEQFTRLAPSYEGKYEGSGLGLHIVKEFLEAMDGEVYVKSEINKGSLFTIFIPFKVALSQSDNENFQNNNDSIPVKSKSAIGGILKESSKLEASISSIKQSSLSKNVIDQATPLNVLLVEDEIIAARAAENILKLCGCHVEVVNSGESALQKFAEGSFDLIFMDVGLPGINGIETTQRIRHLEKGLNKRIPVIALSAHVDPAICLAADMDRVITKPLLKEQAEMIVNEQKKLRSQLNVNTTTSLKIIDLALSAKEMNSDIADAKALLKLFVEELLPMERLALERAYQTHDRSNLAKAAHKMHGSLCYCGAPRLRNAVNNLEQITTSGDSKQLELAYIQFCDELALFMEAYKKL